MKTNNHRHNVNFLRRQSAVFLLGAALAGLTFQTAAGESLTPTASAPAVRSTVAAQASAALVWDSELKEVSAKLGDATATFTFWFTNASKTDITINSVRASCGCTTTKVAPLPWRIAPGTNSPIEVSVDLRGRQGTVAKTVTVDTSAGAKSLSFKIQIPPTQPVRATTSPKTDPAQRAL